ncbi:MAG: hypothetical protein ACR2M0_11360 [Chloroflexia bacterium]
MSQYSYPQIRNQFSGFEALYAEAWEELARLRLEPGTRDWLLSEATPVLAFGDWRNARVATAALNPSEDEFQTAGSPRRELPPDRRRFLHWPQDGELTPNRLAEARRLAEGYFMLGNAYSRWFGRWRGLLEALGATYESGLACQTNYGSPFTTVVGWGAVRSAACRTQLAESGGPIWRRMLELMPKLEIVVGQGAGWRTVPELFGFAPADWEPVSTEFDAKGGKSAGTRPHLLHRRVSIGGRAVEVWWWRPNRGGPLTWLGRDDAQRLGRIISDACSTASSDTGRSGS